MPGRLFWSPALAGFLVICLLGALVACGGGSSTTTTPPPNIVVQIAQSSPSVSQGASLTFTAIVSGTANGAVTWSIQEGSAGGTITSTGVYTAPMVAGNYHVIATSVANPSSSSTVIVNVPKVQMSISPAGPSMGAGESQTFQAAISGCVSPAINWSVQGGAAGGTITAAGVYTAPPTFGTYTVVATSAGCANNSASVLVSVAPLSVDVTPKLDVLGPAGVRNFSASVLGSVTKGVTWTVQEGATGGSITSTGVYTAPASTGTFHVVAASAKDPTTTSPPATVTVVASGFRPTGSMQDSRTAPTETLLKSGKVLVTGGAACFFYYYYYYGSCLLASAELYDPQAGTFSKTGAMATNLVFHTATLLGDGHVLVAGGTTRSPSAELYDETAGTFTATGSLITTRDSHTATLLPNQHVLIIGGKNNLGNPISVSEDYDPTKGTFAASASLIAGRSEHTATVLANGKILVAGGSSGHTALPSAELYDPATNAFTATGSMNAARSGHAATLLPNGNVLITGGTNGTSSLASAEVYDVPTGKFTNLSASMMVARDGHFAVSLPDGRVLIAGGTNSGYVAEIYDPTAQTFTQTGSMSIGRVFAGVVFLPLPDGRVLVAGGSDLNTAEVYK